MTEEPKIYLFNKPSNWSYQDWIDSDARYLLSHIDKNVAEWIYEEDMSAEEKEENPSYKTTGGYLKVLDESQCSQIWWDGLSSSQKKIIRHMPNYDTKIFEEITGIKTGDLDGSSGS